MKVERLLLLCLFLGHLTSCTPDLPIEEESSIGIFDEAVVADPAKDQLRELFDETSAKPVLCAQLGSLEKLERDELGCGSIDKNGLIKFYPIFLELGLKGCHPVSVGSDWSDTKFLGWFYVSDNGYGRGHNEDYGNDCVRWEFLPGLAKTYVGNNLAYMDKSLNIVHQTNFPFGENFSIETNLAIVCSEKPMERIGPLMEHFFYAGGKCGQINSNFEITVPIQLPFENFVALPEWSNSFYSRKVFLRAIPGKSGELQNIILAGQQGLSGLTRSVAMVSPLERDVVVVHEFWKSRSAHRESLQTDQVRAAIKRGKPIINRIENIDEFEYDAETRTIK